MPTQSSQWTTLLGMGVAIAAQLAVFLVLGLVVDKAVGTSPVFLLVGLLLGVIAAVSFVVVKFRQTLNAQKPRTSSSTPSQKG